MAQIFSEATDHLLSEFNRVRKNSLKLFKPLRIEDAVMQSNPFGSPPNWHLAHVTWFYQKVLEKHHKKLSDSKNVNLDYLNSYYQQFRKILPKGERGRYPRPTVQDTLGYRAYVEKEVISFLKEEQGLTEELIYDIQLANQHEMQHQELMIYDLQHYFNRFSQPDDNYNPTTFRSTRAFHREKQMQSHGEMVAIGEGIYELGFNGNGFCYDNELPEHKIYLQSYKIDINPVTNGEYLKFIEDKGYEEFSYWLADGWDLVQEQKWNAPLYWIYDDKQDKWMKKDFRGLREINPNEPVTNVSYYEADAYSRWLGKRIPSEAEWEKAASWNEDEQKKNPYPWGDDIPTTKHANLLESYIWGPSDVGSFPDGRSHYGCYHMIGDVWEWTSSEYTLYPGFRPKFSEYTDKWAINQKVLRGGCFATPVHQIRNSYRNYFKPHERILFSGFRCAIDL